MIGADADVVVIGAGPAGAAAAIVMARSGKRVVLADRSKFPREKCCGDGITGAALPRLRHLGLDPKAVSSWRDVDHSVFVSPSGRAVRLETGGNDRTDVLAIATRADLDAALVDLARAAGAEVIEEARLITASPAADGVALEFDGLGTLLAPYAVAADGAWSPTRRALEDNPDPEMPKWQAARAYVDGVTGVAATEAFVWFDRDLLPGYAWSFPLGDGRANVGVGALRTAGGGGGWIVRRLAALLEADHVRTVLGVATGIPTPTRTVVWPIPTELKRGNLIGGRGRVLFAGDAARATDPMTGEGIAEALQTGQLAAEALVADRADTYVSTAGRALVWRQRRRQLCSNLLRSRVLATTGLAVADQTAWTRRQFTRWIFT